MFSHGSGENFPKARPKRILVIQRVMDYIHIMSASGKEPCKRGANIKTVSRPLEAATARSKGAAVSADVIPLVRPPGRPRGHPKSGGRMPGSKNKRTLEVEAALSPLVPKAKRKLKELMDAQDEKVAFSACMGVLSYVFGRPIDRKQIAGADGEPLIPGADMSAREVARRVAHLLTRPGAEGPDTVAAFTEGSGDGARPAQTRAQAGAHTHPDSAAGAAPASAARKNGKTPPGGRFRPGDSSGGGQRAVAGFENNFSKKTKPKPTEPEPGQAARCAGFVVRCTEGSRPGLPNSYQILDSRGQLMTMSVNGWSKAVAWIRARVGEDADLEVSIIDPTPAHEPVRPDQMPFATGGPDIIRGYTERKV